MEINSLSNSKVKNWAKLKEKKYRDRERRFLIEGEHLLGEAKAAGILVCVIIKQGSFYPVPNEMERYEVSEEIIRKLTSLVSKETVLGVCRYPEDEEIKGERLILLDNVQDPGNLGTIIRSAYSFGYDGVVLSTTCVDAYNDKVIRSTQGALFHLPIYRHDLVEVIKELKQRHVSVYVTSLKNASPLASIAKQSSHAFVFGNEGQGVSDEIMAMSDRNIMIEMKAFESLNVAVAASICMYTFMEK